GQQRGGGRARGVPSGRLPGRDGRRRRQRAAGGVRRGRRPHGLEARLRRVRADGRRRGPGTATAGPAGTGGQGDVVTGVRRGVLQLPAPQNGRASCRARELFSYESASYSITSIHKSDIYWCIVIYIKEKTAYDIFT